MSESLTTISVEVLAEMEAENTRFRAGLEAIIRDGANYNSAWCVAQARGHLLDLDFDLYPDAGRAALQPTETPDV